MDNKYTIGGNDDLSVFKSKFNSDNRVVTQAAEHSTPQQTTSGQKRFTIGDDTDLDKFKSKFNKPDPIQAKQNTADAQEHSVVPVIARTSYNNDAVEAQRVSAASSIPPRINVQPQMNIADLRWQNTKVPEVNPVVNNGMPTKAQEYDIDVPSIVAGKKPVTNERARVNVPVVATKEGVLNTSEKQPSWGKVVGSSLGSGVAQTQSSMFNVPRKVIEGVSIGLDKVLPDFIYNKKMQENDPIKKALDKAVKSNEERTASFQKDLDGAKGIKGFVAAGLPALPQIVMAAFGGAAAQGNAALAKLPEAARQLLPFGTLAAGGYAKEAENEGATYGQQVAYGLLGGTAEAATEVIPLGRALDLMKKFGAGDIAEKGAKTLISKYGKTAMQIVGNLLMEGAQEGIMSPLGKGAQKLTYKPNMAMTGEGGVIDWKDIKDSAYAGISMSVILGGLGLPSAYASHKLATDKIEKKEPITPDFIQNELMPALQKDVASIENESTQVAKIQQAPAEFNWALNQVMSGKNIPAALEAKYPVLVEFKKNLQEESTKAQSEAIQEPINEIQNVAKETIDEGKNNAINETLESEQKPVVKKSHSIGYHAGDLGKAEHFGRQYGSDRGTGHFGTGTYFVGDKKNIEIGGYKERPMHEVDLSDYNLFKPENEKTAKKLHDLLKYTNTYYNAAHRKLVPDDLLDDLNYSEPDVIISELKKLGKWDEEQFQDYFNVSSEEYVDKKLERQDIYKYLRNDLLSGIKNDNERIKKALNYKKEFEENIGDILGVSKEKVAEIVDSIYKDIETQYGSSDNWTMNKDLEKSDSVSTRLMKALGFEGVDVRHIPSFDNTEFGTVVYDLKEVEAQEPTANTLQQPTAEEKQADVQTVAEGEKEAQKDDSGKAKEPAAAKTLKDYGLEVNKTKTAKGNDVWQVPTNESTKGYVDTFHKLKARWYKPHPKAKGVWSFNYDPAEALLKELSGTESITDSQPQKTEEKPSEPTTTTEIQQTEVQVNPEDGKQGYINSGNDDTLKVEKSIKNPSQQIASFVGGKLKNREKFTYIDLTKAADEAYGGTLAQNTYDSKDATDAMELGVNQYLLNDSNIDFTSRDPKVVKESIKKLNELLDLLPTQTKRTDEMVELQQFSTPPTIAYVASWLADITSKDTALEPSAGIGGLAVFGKIAGAKVYVNEYSKRRAEVIKQMGFDQVFTEDGEQIDNILPDKVKPTVVIMNPPFSAAGQRMAAGKTSTMNATKHIEQALNRLEPGGRLVAIVGKGMSDNAPMFKKWWDSIKAEYNVRANVGIDGRNYTKYGTSFDIQMFVIDKTGETENTITAEVKDLEALVDLLGGIADDRRKDVGRTEQVEPAANKPISSEAADESQGDNRRRGPSRQATDDVGDGKPKGPDKGSRGEPGQSGKVEPGADTVGVDTKVDNGTPDKSGEPGSASKTTAGETGAGSGVPNRIDTVNDGRKGTDIPDGKRLEIKSEKQSSTKKKDLGESIYDEYAPQKLKIEGAKQHPGKLAQSAAMAAVEPPAPTYSPKLSKKIVSEGKLSLAQLETVVYAGQAHEQMLENGQRKGFFIGDGTGVGKGRQISGIILDNMNQGRKKAIWISVNDKLFPDAQRDWSALGGKPEEVFSLNKSKLGTPVASKDGIMFLSYDTLASKLDFNADGDSILSAAPSRMKQIVDWFGKDYDGVIVFDEAHKMGNAIEMKAKRGTKKPSARGLAGVELQKLFPKARIVYVSATGATEVSNLAYAERLGLWGRGTEFADKKDFISKITEGGLAAMELVARDMKALGVYIARTLSFDGVKYETLEHELNEDQTVIYDTLAEAWQIVLQNINKALETTGAVDEKGKTLNSNAKKNALGAFWGAEQRFFNQILTSMQMPSVIAQIKKDIAGGNAVVLQLVNTNQASQDRALSKMDDEDMSLEDLDLTPRDALMQYLDKSFPIQQYEDYTDDNGNKRSRPVVDSKGEPVINKAALRMKNELMERVGTMKVPDGPLEMILNSFGADNVAEVTGRTQRVVKVKGKAKLEKRGKLHTEADTNSFMDDKKQILVFSDAGGTGKSYHADLTRDNQRQRVHYLIQAGWRADNAVQGFGRTHRTNQASAPIYRLVTTNLKGHKRFISSIARRLDQLGALTKGQRQTGSQGLFKASDNLEGPLANEALSKFYKDLSLNIIDGLDKKTVFNLMGLDSMLDDYGKINDSNADLRDIPKFLNRILALKTAMQNKVFDAFMERLENYTDAAIANGMLDQGLENYKADKVEIKDEQVVFQDEKTGAETKYYELQAYHKNHPESFSKVSNKPSKFIGYFVNKKSGNVRAVYSAGTTTDDYGRVKEAYRLYSPLNNQRMDMWEFKAGNWEEIDSKTAETEWDKAVAETPEFKTTAVHLISGTLLPIWSKLPGENMKVIRVLTEDGQVLLGRTLQPSQVDMALRRLGASRNKGEFTAPRILKAILEDNNTAELSNGWILKRSKVSGEYRIEIIGKDLWKYTQQLKEDGVFTETIQYNTRYFIPTKDATVLDKVIGYWSVTDLSEPESRVYSSAMTGALPQMPKGDDSATLGGKDGAKTVDEIVSIIEKAIGVPIRTGKFRQKAYGIFKQLPEVIRTKVTNDLPTISHEVGHYLDKLYDLSKKQFDSELQTLGQATSRKSYTKDQIRAEGVAEFVRLYLTDPQQVTLKAPKFLAHFETSISNDLLNELNDLRREIGKANNLPPTQKILNDISIGESRKSTKEASLSGFLQKMYDAWVDEFSPIDRAYKRAVSDGWTGKNVSTMAKIYRGLEAKVKANLKYAQTDLAGNVIGDSLENILKPIRKQYKDFLTYMVSRRAVDYEDKNFVMPQPYWVYQDNVTALEAEHPHFKDVFDNLRKWEDNNIHLLAESGIKTEDTIDEIKKNNPNHVPLYRIQEAVDAVIAGSGNTLGQSKKVIHRAKGSGKTIIDPIESIIADAFIIRRAAEANDILRALADMADNVEGFGDVMEAVPPGMRGTTFNVEEISKALENMGIDTEGVELDSLITIFRANYSERPNEITVYRNGKAKLYQMESEIYKAIKGLNRQASHFLIRIMNIPKRVIQAGAVTTVQFVMRNIARDTGTSLINSEAGINPVDIIKGYASAIKKDKWFKQWILSGGSSEYIQVADRTNVQDLEADILGLNFVDKVREMLNSPTKENVIRVLLSPMRAIREGIEWSESGPRIAEMRKGIEKGISKEEATAWSRDLSQDFLRHGYYGKELNKVTAFFNANVEGIEKQIRTFKEHPYRTLIRGLLYVTLPTMLLYFYNDDNDEYKRMAEWRKALFYNIPLGNRKTTTHFLSIPKPYGWGYLFGALPEIILDEIRHDEPDTWKKIKEGFATNFNIPLMPSAVGPVFDTAINKSWNQAPIESQGDKQKPAYLRYNSNTSSAAKIVANAAKNVAPISPKQLDYMVKGYTGSVGDFFWRLPDTVEKGIQTPDDITNIPVVKSFITDTVYSNDTLDYFYNYGAELEERRKEAQETGTYRAIKHLSENVQNELQGSLRNARLEYNRIADDFTDARKKIYEINGSDKYSPAEKKLKVREIQSKIVKKAEEYNKKYESFKKKYEIK